MNTIDNIPSVDSLNNEKVTKEQSKNKIFQSVLNKCVEKIIYTNRYTDKTFVIFEVPKVLVGYPTYDYTTCILYIINQLSNKQYKVSFIDPFYLYIDWGTNNIPENTPHKHSDNNKLKKQTRELLKKFPNTSRVKYVYEK